MMIKGLVPYDDALSSSAGIFRIVSGQEWSSTKECIWRFGGCRAEERMGLTLGGCAVQWGAAYVFL